MREIKFRAWDAEEKVMREVCAIEYMRRPKFGSLLRLSYWDEKQGLVMTLPPNSELLQYTGLKDKNGKEAYEGDIVKRSEFNDTCDVVYREDWGAFTFHSKHKKISGDGWSRMHSGHSVFPWEVIGNIYENPELLK